jgi:chromosome partitioning protein
MSIAAPPKSKITTKQLVDLWSSLPDKFKEDDLTSHFVPKMFEHLGYGFDRVKSTPNIGIQGQGILKPDLLVYNDPDLPPVLVVELKMRVPELAQSSDASFHDKCKQHDLYKDAVGIDSRSNNNNGIIQYLDTTKVRSECLANYGLVFNGDFWQLWRRVDGLIVPQTTLQRVTKSSLPKLLKELANCLQTPIKAMVAAIWNSKGGVGKTTNTINIAACLAMAGKKVLLIDLDPQQDLTAGIGLKAYPQIDYLDRVYQQLQLQEYDTAKQLFSSAIQSKVYPTNEPGKKFKLSLLAPEKDSLIRFSEQNLQQKVYLVFRSMLALVQHDYDYIFIDASPKLDNLGWCLLCAADAVLLPTEVGGQSLQHALDLSLRVIPQLQTERDKSDSFTVGPWSLGLVYSRCDKDLGLNISRAIEAEIAKQGFTGKIAGTRLTNYDMTKVAEFKGLPVVCWQGSQITKLFQQLTNEVFLGHNYINY